MELQEYRSYVGLEARDEALLSEAWAHVAPHTQTIVDAFYDNVLRHESTRSIISDEAQVLRLKRTLVGWLEELFCGPYDDAYVARRRRIGEVHVRVGVGHAVMFAAMSALQEHLLLLVAGHGDDPHATACAVRKITLLDLELMTDTYHATREQRLVRDGRTVLVAHLPAVALLLDETGEVQSATTAACWFFGTDAEPRAHFRDVLPRALLEETDLERHVQRARATRGEVRLPRVDAVIRGETQHMSVTIVPFEEPSPGTILYFENHTAAVEGERRVQRTEHLATIGTLSATIAHELRNPLAGISGALQVISAGFAEDDRRRAIMGKVLEQVRGLDRMVTDLLAFARPDRARKQSGIDLRALTEDVFAAAAEQMPEARLSVTGRAEANVDPTMLTQILLNLVLNACQAAKGTPLVSVHVSEDRVVISDDGPGLPPAIAQRIFEPFFTTKLKGTGLGLPISRKLARAMGGDLTVGGPSALDGAVFTLWLRRPRQEE